MAIETTDGLLAALGSAAPGDFIDLGDAVFSAFFLYGARHPFARWPRPVTLVGGSFDSARLKGVQGLRFQGTRFASRLEVDHAKSLWIEDSHDIGLFGTKHVGLAGPWGVGQAIRADRCARVRIDGADITGFRRGVVLNYGQKLSVRNSALHRLSGDGINIAACVGVSVDRNHIHTFIDDPASRFHRDAIQLWSAGVDRPTRSVSIIRNIIDAKGEDGGFDAQSIFARNEAVDRGAGPEMRYGNIRVRWNLIRQAHAHGVKIDHADNIDVCHNTLLQDNDAARAAAARFAEKLGPESERPLWTPAIHVQDVTGRIVNNIAEQPIYASGDQAGLIVRGHREI